MALPKKYRLPSKSEIEKVFKKGKIINSNFLSIRSNRNNLSFSRFVVIVSLKISKKAVVRNKIKRRLSEIIRLNILKSKPGYDLVFSVKTGILGQNYGELKELLVNEASRIK